MRLLLQPSFLFCSAILSMCVSKPCTLSLGTVRSLHVARHTSGACLADTCEGLWPHCRYQFSLAYFTRMFSQCIADSAKSDHVATRLQLLSDYTTSFVFKSVSRLVIHSYFDGAHIPVVAAISLAATCATAVTLTQL